MQGKGRPARRGDVVCIDFAVHSEDRSHEYLWDQNFCFELGAGVVVAGFDAGVDGMMAGGQRTVVCPPHLHWGRGGYGEKIPPNATLVFEIDLVSID